MTCECYKLLNKSIQYLLGRGETFERDRKMYTCQEQNPRGIQDNDLTDDVMESLLLGEILKIHDESWHI
jgi:hypothetical protein